MSIQELVRIASNKATLIAAEAVAAERLAKYCGDHYPTNGCAITLSILLQEAGFDFPDTYLAIQAGERLEKLGWRRILPGEEKLEPGDVGSTCGKVADHGEDHIYLVFAPMNPDENLVVDNQARVPHPRSVSGKDGKTPTRFFLRAPAL